MTQPNMPMAPPNPFAGVTDPCALAATLHAALLNLMCGGTPSAVKFGDQEIHFSRSNIPEMRLEISRLTAMCEAKRGIKRTVRAGPSARWTAGRNGYGFGGY